MNDDRHDDAMPWGHGAPVSELWTCGHNATCTQQEYVDVQDSALRTTRWAIVKLRDASHLLSRRLSASAHACYMPHAYSCSADAPVRGGHRSWRTRGTSTLIGASCAHSERMPSSPWASRCRPPARLTCEPPGMLSRGTHCTEHARPCVPGHPVWSRAGRLSSTCPTRAVRSSASPRVRVRGEGEGWGEG